MSERYVWQTLIESFLVTLKIFGYSIIFSTILGLLLALCNYTKVKPITLLVQTIVWIFRGTPIMLQLIIVYYGLAFYGIYLEMMTAAILVFSISYGVYMSEIFRGAFNSVAKGQKEACKVLGINPFWAFTVVILPQAIKTALNPICEMWITLAKDTSLARVIGIIEITRAAQTMVSASTYIYPLLYTVVFYLALGGLITILFKIAERKLRYYSV